VQDVECLCVYKFFGVGKFYQCCDTAGQRQQDSSKPRRKLVANERLRAGLQSRSFTPKILKTFRGFRGLGYTLEPKALMSFFWRMRLFWAKQWSI